jgi:hypothetical protein
MTRSIKALIIFLIGFVSLVFLYKEFMSQRNRVDAEVLEREVRAALPLGSPLADVEGFLQKRGMEFSFDASSRAIYAAARGLKGSTSITRKDLTLKFHFDNSLILESIDAKVLYTGP